MICVGGFLVCFVVVFALWCVCRMAGMADQDEEEAYRDEP